MPIPNPSKTETKNEFISRCTSSLSDEYKDNKQRLAICFQKWEDRKKEADATLIINGEETVFFAPKGE